MPALPEFTREVERRLETADELRRQDGDRLAESMRPREAVRQAFERVAEVVYDAIVRPRTEALAQHFEHATLEHLATPGGRFAQCFFRPTDRFPVTASVSLGVALNEEGTGGVLCYTAELKPALVEYEDAAGIVLPLEGTPWEALTAWVEGKLLGFEETYLTVGRDPAYQRDNVHVDRVCGMPVPAAVAQHSATYEGRTSYFCAAACRARFLEHPALYVHGVARLPDAAGRRGGNAVTALSHEPPGRTRGA